MPAPRPSSQRERAHAFGDRIRRLRKERGLSQAALGELVSMNGGHLSKIENGKTGPPSDEVIARLADALGADRVELMHVAGRGLDRQSFEERVLDSLERLVVEQRAGFERLNEAIAKLVGR